MKIIYLILFISLISCNNQKKEIATNKLKPKVENTDKIDEVFLEKVVIILSEELRGDENTINIQDYVQNGKSFIPIFSSIQKFNESTQGNLNNQKIEIDGILLLSLMNGDETLRLNPGLQDEIDFNSGKLKEKYFEKIMKIKAEMENIKNGKK